MTIRIIPGDVGDSRVAALLRVHLTGARAQTAPGSAHALDFTSLQSSEVTFWTAWDGDRLLGIGALKRLSPEHGEIKSMHTAESARHRGVGRAMLRHIIATAQRCGMSRLSLETGSWPFFQPARELYRSQGFTECPPFADYSEDSNSVFMTMDLTARRTGDGQTNA